MQTGEIEIAPLAFMRGRTLSNAAIILDEAQNTTAMQMKMLLTRLGENSRMMVTGDPSQVDLPPGQTSGLPTRCGSSTASKASAMSAFTAADVIRHELVARIVEAYDNDSGEEARAPGMTRAARPALTIDVLVVSNRWRIRRKAQIGRCGAPLHRPAAALSTTATELAIVLDR